MGENAYLDFSKVPFSKSYQLPRVHSSNQQQHNLCRVGKRNMRLGINARTGRLQWCPGVTCNKILIIFPVVLLPITIALILLMRIDNILTAFRTQQEQRQPQQYSYIDDFTNNLLPNKRDVIEDIISEQFILPVDMKKKELIEHERIKRCMSFKFGLSETIEVEDRDIMKDARTSFLPRDTTAIPRECLDRLTSVKADSSLINEMLEQLLRRRSRRTSVDKIIYDKSKTIFDDTVSQSGKINLNNFDTVNEQNPLSEEDAQLFGSTSALQTFWNEEGTKETIRIAQAKTMKKYMDHHIDPCTDFYKYACGNWERLHPIPKDKAGFDTFEMLRENLDVVLRELLESKEATEVVSAQSKIVNIPHNNYEHDIDTHADIIKSGPSAPAAISAVKKELGASKPFDQLEKQLKEKSARIRRHIIEHRDALSLVLRRYKRQQAKINKRNRLITLFSLSNLSSEESSFTEYVDSNDAQLKAKYLYQSCINTNLLQKRGIKPLLNLIDSLGGWPVLNPNWNSQTFDWLNLTAQLRRYNNDILIVEWVGPDIKNSDENVIQFDQTSLGLPTREYYLQDMNSRYLRAYQLFMSEIMQKLGASRDRAIKTAADVVVFETQLASITAPAEQRLNVTKLYNRMTLKNLHEAVPEINWLRYLSILQNRNVRDTEQVVIYALDYMNDLVRLIRTTEPTTVSNYLLWRFVRHRINNVDDRFEDTKQKFYHSLFGREESPQRWKVCIAQVNTNMGMALGSMFVRRYFDENSKRDTLKMTHELQQAFREILKNTDWLDSSTKHLAELKVNAMSLKIGYPDFILNPAELNEKYTGIRIHPDKYFENTLHVLLHTAKTEQNKIQESVNKTAWQTAPAIVNAYYSRNKNQIMFPAGILQPPFYHRHFPRSLNFGGIGVVIGHELTHGFDDKGRLFDRNGSIHKWWTDAAIKGFDERARCIISQYSNYTVGEVGISLNGESTQGENIADNGGLRQAFHAYKNWLINNPQAAADERLPGIDMTAEQLFFLNFGQVWCGAMRPEAVRNKLNTAIHSPGRFRVIGTLSNSKDFAREFKCPEGSPMNPIHKCSVW
ncbi:PREDICTED: membrane metallo-endopeptidase-like 1 isoform X1 [Bactrocera latifrons]|uniref:Endothelin-converting enzyme 1 n=1 Tax=Bactrocera latifrons TaxID=174628 RepID=A0A0K8VA93_BACLA|nr:PREDICTED: membrane metallo-endopeptidase-like 1 isoform X1 [Bactrocera latifrons]